MRLRNKSVGSALLTALFIMTLVAIVATAMTTRLQLDIYRTRLVINHDKMLLASQAVTFWALSLLDHKQIQLNKVDKQGMIAHFPQALAKIHNQQIVVEGGMYDLQARFNLNNLTEKKSIPLFINLVSEIYPQATKAQQMALAIAVRDWLLPYDLSRGKDNYTSYYLGQKPPYYPGHQLMKSSSELRLVKEVSQQVFLTLEPYVTALPDSTLPVNINTASKQVLMALGNGLSDPQASELISARGGAGISDLKDIAELIKKLDLPGEQITIESQYFLSVAYIHGEDLNLTIYTLLKRSRDNKGKLSVGIIRQSMNGF